MFFFQIAEFGTGMELRSHPRVCEKYFIGLYFSIRFYVFLIA